MNKPARKKLIEVALPLEAINVASAREKSIRHGHPSTLHLWWARRPLAAARAVIFAQMVDDPSSWPDLFTSEKAQEKERQRLFDIIEDLVQWENTTNEEVLQKARDEIWRSWRRACAENVDHPQAKALFDREKLPTFHDPFAGGGALPLEAQRLGFESYASDLNPVAVLINKAMIEIPPKFADKPPVNPEARKDPQLFTREWKGAEGLAEDVRYYGKWMRDEALKRIGHLYPKVKVTSDMVAERPDLQPYLNRELTVLAWLWARTVKSPNPAFRDVEVPLVSSFLLASKPGKEAYVSPKLVGGDYTFEIKTGKPRDLEAVSRGTKAGGSHSSFLCIMSGAPITFEYIRQEGLANRMGERLMAIVAEGDRGRVYLPPQQGLEAVAKHVVPSWHPDTELHGKCRVNVSLYGLNDFGDLFTPRQLTALTTFSDLVGEAKQYIREAAHDSGFIEDSVSLEKGGTGADGYSDAVATYLALAASKAADNNSTMCSWMPGLKYEVVRNTFSRQALAMSWDYAESNPFAESSGDFFEQVKRSVKVFEVSLGTGKILPGIATQADASRLSTASSPVFSTDPPYYDNIGYADLSDFFYVWLRRSLKSTFPSLFATLASPKAEELVATPFRHKSREEAESFFLNGMTSAMHQLARQAHPAFPVTIYYAFKQSETTSDGGESSTGWETFLDAVLRAGFSLTGTWPMRTERSARSIGVGANALASSIILVCRQREASAAEVTRREFLIALEKELPKAIADLQRGNVAPVDLQQASIGPGMAIFSRYSKVLDADGKPLSVKAALMLINQALDEVLADQEGDFDSDTRWALAWFEQFGFAEGDYGVAETLSKAKNTSVDGIRQAGIGTHGKGKVRLFKPEELPPDWSPESDSRLTVWDMVHHLIRTLEQGEEAAGRLLAKLGVKADAARELAYRLYSICERKKRSVDGQRYNGLVSSWPELVRLSHQTPRQEQGPQQSFEGMN